jgi:hypothetical protein
MAASSLSRPEGIDGKRYIDNDEACRNRVWRNGDQMTGR